MAEFWRVRMTRDRGDVSEVAWNRREVGIWYGPWSEKDLQDAQRGDAYVHLSNLGKSSPTAAWTVSKKDVTDAIKFASLPEDAWVVICFNETIAIAQLDGKLTSVPGHELNEIGGLFKFRKLKNERAFKLAELPPIYRMLVQHGRSTLDPIHSLKPQAEVLTRCHNPAEVYGERSKKTVEEWLQDLHASEWESVCEAYLISEEQFMPSGLRAGRTLKKLDLVGFSLRQNKPLYAQCKNGSDKVAVEKSFIDLAAENPSHLAYYFARGGAYEVPNLILITETEIAQWLKHNPTGQKYLALMRPHAPEQQLMKKAA